MRWSFIWQRIIKIKQVTKQQNTFVSLLLKQLLI